MLTQLGNEGFTAELAREHMNVGADHVLPTPGATPVPPTPEPATPEPAPPCIDAMAFVEHLTQPGEILPGQNYTKGWRVQNTGTCTWNTNYRLEFAGGQAMGGSPVAVTRSVAPGETYDFEAPLVAPLNDGEYQAVWQMVNEDNQAFGERLVVVMTVGARATPTPAPTQTPVPGIDLSVTGAGSGRASA